MTYKDEFPSYDDELPDLSPLSDESWCNDMCPCFAWTNPDDPDLSRCRIELWCDFKSRDRRDHGDEETMQRFGVCVRDLDGNILSEPVSGETLEELREACNAWYLENVGYRPDSEDDSVTVGQLVLDVGQLAYLHQKGLDQTCG